MNAYRPCTATPVATGTDDVQGVAAAAFNLRHGDGNGDPLLVVGELAANGSDVRWFGPQGIACPGGVWVEQVSGEAELVLYTLALPGNL